MNDVDTIKAKYPDKSIVFVSGNFNIVHPGHLRLLRFAKDCGDVLVVGVYADSIATNALLNEVLRLEAIDSISWVDESFLLCDPPDTFISKLKPDIVVKGKEHENANNPEADAVRFYGGKLLFCSGETVFSSIDLLHEEFRHAGPAGLDMQPAFLKRHGLEQATLAEKLQGMKELRVAVIGELIVDDYVTCEPLGMSREDPTIVVSPIVSDRFVGGAGIVAAHASGLGAAVDFFSVTGNDENASYAAGQLARYGVEGHLYQDESRPTILKQRFRADDKTLLRVSHLRQHSINRDITSRILQDVKSAVKGKGFDLLIFSDFNYGLLHQGLVDEVVDLCRGAGIMMVADSQSSSQTGDVSRFQHMAFLTPTEHEARLAVKDHDSGLVVLAEKIRKQANSRHILVTLGEEGVLIHARVSNKSQWLTDQLRPMNRNPKDVAGAGDSFLVGASMALAVGANIWESAYLGSLAAACQVGRVGNIPIAESELKAVLASMPPSSINHSN